MIDQVRRAWRAYRGRCPGCGVEPEHVVRITVDVDETFEDCPECGSPHEIFGVMRCPTCYALLDDGEVLYPDDESEEMEFYR